MNIAIFNSFSFHYEMFGYVIDYCKKNSINLDIYTNMSSDLGWFDFYKSIFSINIIDYKNFLYDNNYQYQKRLI